MDFISCKLVIQRTLALTLEVDANSGGEMARSGSEESSTLLSVPPQNLTVQTGLIRLVDGHEHESGVDVEGEEDGSAVKEHRSRSETEELRLRHVG